MNLNPHEISELDELTLAYHEGALSAAQAKRLEALVLQDPAACAEFVKRSAIVTDLQWQFGAVNANAFPLRPPAAGANPTGDDSTPAASVAASTVVDAAGSASAGGLPITPAPAHPLLQNAQQHPLLYLAAGIVLFVTLWSVTGRLFSGRGEMQAIGRESPLGIQRSVARLTRTLDAQWGVGTINDGAFLRGGQRLELVAGLAEITYKNGAVVLLEAPVSYQLNDREAEYSINPDLKNCDGFLEVGRISVRVPQAAHGFAIRTAAATITDMGAEFGLAVGPSDELSLVVFAGSAELLTDDRHGNWRQRVDAGGSLRFDRRELSPVPQGFEEAGPFVRKLPEQEPPLMLHWSFDSVADDGKLVLDQSGQGRHGRFVGNAGRMHSVSGRAGFGRALSLNGVDEFVELIEPQWSRLDDSFEEFTVAFWIKPTELPAFETMICGKMGFKFRRGWQISLMPDGKPRFVFFRAASDNAPISLVGDKALPIGKSSHLAMTFKGLESARLYLDGELVGTLDDVPMRMNGANRVNLQLGNRGDGFPGRYFEGLIDDFRVYQIALSGTMVRRLMQIAEPATSSQANFANDSPLGNSRGMP